MLVCRGGLEDVEAHADPLPDLDKAHGGGDLVAGVHQRPPLELLSAVDEHREVEGHGAQEFEWGPLVHAGDQITTSVRLESVSERIGMRFYVFESASANQRGDEVCAGRWTQIVRPRP